MNRQILVILGILLIGSIGAYNITAGESFSFDLEEEFEYYSIVGNSTQVDLIVEQNGTIVTITVGKYTKSDSFELIFFDKEKEVITKGGGSGGTRYRDRNVTIEKNVTVDDTDKYKEKIDRLREDKRDLKRIIRRNNIEMIILGSFLVLFAAILLLITIRATKTKKPKPKP